jgi:hypothetical protein
LEEQKLYTFDLSKVGKIEWEKSNLPKWKSSYTPYTNTAASCGVSYRSQGNSRGRWNAAQGKWEEIDDGRNGAGMGDDDWDDDSMLGWTSRRGGNGHAQHNASRNDGVSVGGSRPVSFPLGAERIVEATKKALSENRADRTKRESGNTDTGNSSGLDSGVAEAIAKVIADSKNSTALGQHTARRLSKKEKKKQRVAETKAENKEEQGKLSTTPRATESKVSGSGDFMCPPHWFDTSSATGAEQQGAKSAGVMGELQWFKGALYEPETGELYGDIEEYVPGVGGGKLVHTGIMRNMTAAAADQAWINNKETGGWVAIVGVTDDNRVDITRALIVTPLTEAGLKQMKNQAA